MINSLLRDVTCVVALSVTLVAVGEAWSQGLNSEQQSQLSQIQALNDPAAFIEQAQNFWQSVRQGSDAAATEEVQQALGARAKQWLEDTSTLKSIDIDQARALGGLAASGLTTADKDQLVQQIEATLSDPATTSFEQLEARVTLLSGLVPNAYEQRREFHKFVDDWIEAHELTELTQSQLNACFLFARSPVSDADGFKVVWSGFITAPSPGSYEFSVSPWNVSMSKIDEGQFTRNQQSMAVRVNGELVVNAQPDTWIYEGDPIELVANLKTPIRVEFSYERNDDRRLCPAIVYWKGPGITKSVVPASALSIDETGTPGLQAEYVWTEQVSEDESKQVIERTVDPNIDFAWQGGLTIMPRNAAMQRLAAELVNRWTRADGDFIGDIARRPQLVAILSSSQLAACLQSVIDRPEQLESVSPARISRFFQATRCGADNQAIDVLGIWMNQHPYLPAVFAANIDEHFRQNRLFHYRLVEYLEFERPKSRDRLEEHFLQMEDDRCCLTVAFTLAYCHYLSGTIPEWIEQLEDRLADESLRGDQRVSWLLARAHAEELHHLRAGRYWFTHEQLMAGEPWLDEAALVAESTSSKQIIDRERISRLVTSGFWESVEKELTAAAQNGAEGEIAAWRVQVEAAKERAAQHQVETERKAQQSYIDELKRRREKASDRNDEEALRSYDQLLSESETHEP